MRDIGNIFRTDIAVLERALERAGLPAKLPRGRPKFDPGVARTKSVHIRLNEDRAAKLRALGRDWLEAQIDSAEIAPAGRHRQEGEVGIPTDRPGQTEKATSSEQPRRARRPPGGTADA